VGHCEGELRVEGGELRGKVGVGGDAELVDLLEELA
jgi:hypothetical protein